MFGHELQRQNSSSCENQHHKCQGTVCQELYGSAGLDKFQLILPGVEEYLGLDLSGGLTYWTLAQSSLHC